MKHLSAEVGRLIQTAKTDRDRLVITLVLKHGLRVSEVLALTRSHVEYEGSTQ